MVSVFMASPLRRGQLDALGMKPLHQLAYLSVRLTRNASHVNCIYFVGWPAYGTLANKHGLSEKPSLDCVVDAGVRTVPGFGLYGWHSKNRHLISPYRALAFIATKCSN
jgi:hypothetical protein